MNSTVVNLCGFDEPPKMEGFGNCILKHSNMGWYNDGILIIK